MSRPLRPFAAFTLLSFLPACGGSAPPAEAPKPAPEAAAPEPAPEARAAPEAKAAPSKPKPIPASEREPESVVQMSFEPLVMGVRPGGTLVLAAHFRIAPGYRISWKASGDVGQPTSAIFRAPPGFDVGPVQFPAPERYAAPGGFTGYGYENETAVFVEVKAPGNLRKDAVSRFDVDASWVACKGRCATERGSAFVELGTVWGDTRARDVEASVAPFRARVPKPLTALKDAEATWDETGKDAVLLVKLPGATPKEFFSDGTADPKPLQTNLAEGEIRFVYDEAARAGSRPLRGVIAAAVDGKGAFFDFEAPLAGAEEDAKDEKKAPSKPPPPTKKK